MCVLSNPSARALLTCFLSGSCSCSCYAASPLVASIHSNATVVADPDYTPLRMDAVAAAANPFEFAVQFNDLAYDLFVEPGRELCTVLLDDVEPAGPKGLITGTTAVIRDTARVISASENGLVRTYAFGIVAGLALAGVVLAIVVAGAS